MNHSRTSRRKSSCKRASYIVICKNHPPSSYSPSCPCCSGCEKIGMPFVEYREFNRDKYEGYYYHASGSITKVAAEKRLKELQIDNFILKPCRARVTQKEIQAMNKKRPAYWDETFDENEEMAKFLQTSIAQAVKIEVSKQSSELISELKQFRKEVTKDFKDSSDRAQNLKKEVLRDVDSKMRSFNEEMSGVQRKQNELTSLQHNQERQNQEILQKQEELEEKQQKLEEKQQKSEEKQEKLQATLDSIADKFSNGVNQQTSTMEQFGQTMQKTLQAIQKQFLLAQDIQKSPQQADHKYQGQAKAPYSTTSVPSPPMNELFKIDFQNPVNLGHFGPSPGHGHGGR